MTKVYKWELFKLLAQKRTYLGLGAAMLVPLIFVTVLILKTGGPNDIPLGRYIRRDRARDAVRGPVLHVDLGLPADHGTRRRRHRRLGEPQRDVEDDPHALAEPGRDLRREDLRHVHLHRRCRLRNGPRCVRRGEHRMGLQRPHLAVGNDGQRVARSRPARREPRDLRLADGGHRSLRPLPLDRDPQQRGRGGRER